MSKKDPKKKYGLIEIMVGVMVLTGIFGTIWALVDSMAENTEAVSVSQDTKKTD